MLVRLPNTHGTADDDQRIICVDRWKGTQSGRQEILPPVTLRRGLFRKIGTTTVVIMSQTNRLQLSHIKKVGAGSIVIAIATQNLKSSGHDFATFRVVRGKADRPSLKSK